MLFRQSLRRNYSKQHNNNSASIKDQLHQRRKRYSHLMISWRIIHTIRGSTPIQVRREKILQTRHQRQVIFQRDRTTMWVRRCLWCRLNRGNQLTLRTFRAKSAITSTKAMIEKLRALDIVIHSKRCTIIRIIINLGGVIKWIPHKDIDKSGLSLNWVLNTKLQVNKTLMQEKIWGLNTLRPIWYLNSMISIDSLLKLKLTTKTTFNSTSKETLNGPLIKSLIPKNSKEIETTRDMSSSWWRHKKLLRLMSQIWHLLLMVKMMIRTKIINKIKKLKSKKSKMGTRLRKVTTS